MFSTCLQSFESQNQVTLHCMTSHPVARSQPTAFKTDAIVQTEESNAIFCDKSTKAKNVLAILNGSFDDLSTSVLTKEDLLEVISKLTSAIKEIHPDSWDSIVSKSMMETTEQVDISENKSSVTVVQLSCEPVERDPLVVDDGKNDHSDSDNDKKRNWCSDCDKTFSAKRKLREHIATVHYGWGPEEIKCEFCSQTFRKKTVHRIHVDTVHKGRQVEPCQYCRAIFTSKENLKNHIKRKHPEKVPPQVKEVIETCCKICNNKDFKTGSHLARHVRSVHQKLKNFTCDVCGMAFCFRQGLKKHTISVHENVRNYKCERCPQAFKHSGGLLRHIRDVHEGITNHQCQFCGKEFAQAGNMRIHLKKHHNTIEDPS